MAGVTGGYIGVNFMNQGQRTAAGEKAKAVLETVGNALFTKEGDDECEAVTEQQPNAVAKAIGSFANIVANGHFDGLYDSSTSDSRSYGFI